MYPFFFLDRLGQHPVGLCVVRRNKASEGESNRDNRGQGSEKKGPRLSSDWRMTIDFPLKPLLELTLGLRAMASTTPRLARPAVSGEAGYL